MGDDAARAIYLLMLGALVASGVLATYRGRMGAALKHAFIWAMIFAAMALLYLVANPDAGFIPMPGHDDRFAAVQSG